MADRVRITQARILIGVLLILLLLGGWIDTHDVPSELWP